MINNKHKERLKINWGEKADSMACMAEVRIYDPLSTWQCYIYALNPEDEDEVYCLVKVGDQQKATVERWYLTNIYNLFNYHGEKVKVDQEYRPRRVDHVLKKLNELEIYESHRD